MDRKQIAFILELLFVTIYMLTCSKTASVFQSNWPEKTTRYWIGPEYWTNRLQDWRINEGRLECVTGTKPLRTVHLLTHWLAPRDGDLNMSVHTGVLSRENKINKDAWCGFLIGVGSLNLDYRARAIIHQASGENGGLAAGINGRGEIVFYDNISTLKSIQVSSLTGEPIGRQIGDEVQLQMSMKSSNGTYTITLSVYDIKKQKLLIKASIENINADRLTGNLALVSNGAHDENGASFWFRDWKVSGSKVDWNPEQSFGPIFCALHTLSDRTLKMTAQMPPMAQTDPQTIRLQVRETGTKKWKIIAEEKMIIPGWTVPFRILNWDDTKDYNYRLVYSLPLKNSKTKNYYYKGNIRHNPREKDEIVVAAFTGNNNTHGSFGKNYSFTKNRLWFPHKDLIDYVKIHKPDVLVYTGDNVYEGRPTAPDRSGEFSSYLDYLYKWYMFCWAHGELARNAVTVCMTDDHDVYHGNIWGDGGKKAPQEPEYGIYPAHYKGFENDWVQDQGGYRMPAEFVKMVERTQTSHLPDPYDPTPVEQGIGVYYTSMNYGGISFAVLEDRKFKSPPSVMVPEAKIVNGFSQIKSFDYRKLDVPGAQLLGDRQLKFLKDWAADWRNSWMKVALQQSIFANVSTYPKHFKTDAGTPELKPEPMGVIPKNYVVAQDMDSNGWPQTGRNKALHELRRGFAFMIGGDQHLGTVVHHGIDEWNDAGYSFCVPSIANLWPRRWFPQKKGVDHQPGTPEYTGSYLDGFGNRITVLAVSNPYITNYEPAELHDRAPGYGIIRLNKKEQKIIMECWPRYSDPSKTDAEQYLGWPITISMKDNYGRKALAYLPTLKYEGIENPVVQVIEEPNEDIVYTMRVIGNTFRPKVFKESLYTVKIGEPETDKVQTLEHILPLRKDEEKTIALTF